MIRLRVDDLDIAVSALRRLSSEFVIGMAELCELTLLSGVSLLVSMCARRRLCGWYSSY